MTARSAFVLSFLVILGCWQMAADLLGMPRLKALAAATQLSPAMKVFAAHDGYETHAAKFALSWKDRDGLVHELRLTPAVYRNIDGPYNRRNVYGAALAYGPLLRINPQTRQMQESVMQYAFCSPGILREELRIPVDATQLRVRVMPVRPLQRSGLELEWEARCDE
jgi:hypothetical protein